MWSSAYQQQHHLGNCHKYKSFGSNARPTGSETLELGPLVCVVTSPSEDSNSCSRVRTITLKYTWGLPEKKKRVFYASSILDFNNREHPLCSIPGYLGSFLDTHRRYRKLTTINVCCWALQDGVIYFLFWLCIWGPVLNILCICNKAGSSRNRESYILEKTLV